jgi:hypothetical protein
MNDPAKSSSINLLVLSQHNFPSLFHISSMPSNMTKYNEDPWCIFENAQSPDLLLIANIAPRRKKGSKSKKMPKRPVTKYH